MAVTTTRRSSLLSDDLLQQLIAAGQADIVVGVPTLDNASTVGPVVAAAQHAAAAIVGQRRVLVLNADGGSSDGTQQAVAQATSEARATVLASYSLRTMHRIIAPYHGVAGKQTALRTILAVADLVQARAAIVVDPNGVDPSSDVFAALIAPVLDDEADVAVATPDRDPREGPLVTQAVRPLLVGALGAAFDDPVGGDIALGTRWFPELLPQPAWDDEPVRPGIDLWLRTHVMMRGARALQVATAPRVPAAGPRLSVREVVQQVMRALWRTVEFATQASHAIVADAPTTRRLSSGPTTEPSWDVREFDRTFRDAAHDIAPLWRGILAPRLVDALLGAAALAHPTIADDTWADVLVECTRAAVVDKRADEVAAAFVPIYLGRAASFLTESHGVPADQVQRRLDAMTALVVARRERLVDMSASPGGS